jgi:hypothetical protein
LSLGAIALRQPFVLDLKIISVQKNKQKVQRKLSESKEIEQIMFRWRKIFV